MREHEVLADVAEALSGADEPLERTVALVRDHLGADRVSLVRFEDDGATFRVAATAGLELCSPGTRLPVATSSHYTANTEGRAFALTDLTDDRTFDRSSDELMRSRGFASTCSVPLAEGRRRIGALNVSSCRPGGDLGAAAGTLTAVGGMLAVALAREVTPGPSLLVCHDDPVVALGLARLCEEAGAVRVAVTATVDAALATLPGGLPDVILCDDHLDGAPVAEVARRLRQAGAAAPLVVVATHDTPENVRAALRAGASAYLPRVGVVDALVGALATLRAGRTVLPDVPADDGPSSELTPRELEVLRGLACGERVKQVAWALGVSESTAKNHLRAIFRKLGVTSRIEALDAARRQGILR